MTDIAIAVLTFLFLVSVVVGESFAFGAWIRWVVGSALVDPPAMPLWAYAAVSLVVPFRFKLGVLVIATVGIWFL